MIEIQLDRKTFIARKTPEARLIKLPNGNHELVQLSKWHWNQIDKITADSWSFDGLLYGALTMIEEGWPGDLSTQISMMVHACSARMNDALREPANDNTTKDLYAL